MNNRTRMLYFLPAMALLMTAGCERTEMIAPEGNGVIAFALQQGMGVERNTRSVTETILGSLDAGFGVAALYDDGSVMFNEAVSKDGAKWVTATRYQYPATGTVSFHAVYPKTQSITVSGGKATLQYDASAAAADLVAASKTGVAKTKEPVPLAFEHILAQLRIRCKGTDTGVNYSLTAIKVTAPGGGTYSYADGTWTAEANTGFSYYSNEAGTAVPTATYGDIGEAMTFVPGTVSIEVSWSCKASQKGAVKKVFTKSISATITKGVLNTLSLLLPNSQADEITFGDPETGGWTEPFEEIETNIVCEIDEDAKAGDAESLADFVLEPGTYGLIDWGDGNLEGFSNINGSDDLIISPEHVYDEDFDGEIKISVFDGEVEVTIMKEDSEDYNVTDDAKFKVKKILRTLIFEASNTQTVSFIIDGTEGYSGYINRNFQYSYDCKKWYKWNCSALIFGTSDHPKVYVIGDNPEGINTVNYKVINGHFVFGNATKVACDGDVTALVNYFDEEVNIKGTGENDRRCFATIFKNCVQLTRGAMVSAKTAGGGVCCEMYIGCTALTQMPELNIESVGKECYYKMFAGCTSLATATVLPATTLGVGCYSYMFEGCTALVTAPALPATTLKDNCYKYMFSGCTALTTAPELKATKLDESCYEYMFDGCTAMTAAPELKATTLSPSCYGHMFNGCSSLTTAPALNATTLRSHCYEYMFSGCTALTTAPELKATKLDEYSCCGMFSGCTSLITAPELLSTTLSSCCYEYMFNGCTALTTAPELNAWPAATNCYSHMFENCTSLTTVQGRLPAAKLAPNCYEGMFKGCTSLTTAPELPATTLDVYCYREMFSGCSALTTVSDLTTTWMSKGCYQSMFYGCTALTTAPEIPSPRARESSCEAMFKGCTALKTPPTTLASDEVGKYCFKEMFSGCTALTKAPALPAATLTEGCYAHMFENCTKLNTAPTLNAAKAVKDCYRYMFNNCTSMTTIKCLVENIKDVWQWETAYHGLGWDNLPLSNKNFKITIKSGTLRDWWHSINGLMTIDSGKIIQE